MFLRICQESVQFQFLYRYHLSLGWDVLIILQIVLRLLILVLSVLLIRGIDYYNLKYLLIFAPFQSSWAYTTWTSQDDISLQNSSFDTFNNQLHNKGKFKSLSSLPGMLSLNSGFLMFIHLDCRDCSLFSDYLACWKLCVWLLVATDKQTFHWIYWYIFYFFYIYLGLVNGTICKSVHLEFWRSAVWIPVAIDKQTIS